MPIEITMPQQSDTMTEGTVVRWVKKEGEKVKAAEIVAEIETDKATMEMESFDAGTMAVQLVKEGEKAPVGAVIAVLATAKESVEDVKRQYASGAKQQGASKPQAAAFQGATSKPATAGRV